MGQFAYFPHTPEDIRAMLEKVSLRSLEDLYGDVPEEFVRKEEYDLPEALSEEEVRARFAELSARNVPMKVFVGAGAYDHYAPSVIPYLLSRSESSTLFSWPPCQ